MSALTPKADVRYEVKRLVPPQSRHQMGTWGEIGTIGEGQIRPNSLI